MRFGLMVVLVTSAGCFSAMDSAGDGDFMDDDLPMGSCATTGTCPSGNVPDDSPCQTSTNCMSGSCVAPYVDGAVGQFVCTSQCVAVEDETKWCLDDSACCDPNAFCNPRGLCMMPAALDDTVGPDTGDTDESESSTTDATTGDATTGDATSTGDLETSDTGATAGSTTG